MDDIFPDLFLIQFRDTVGFRETTTIPARLIDTRFTLYPPRLRVDGGK